MPHIQTADHYSKSDNDLQFIGEVINMDQISFGKLAFKVTFGSYLVLRAKILEILYLY